MTDRRIAIDAHVIEGKAQGSRTTLIQLLRAIAKLGYAEHFSLYCRDPKLCLDRIGSNGFNYVTINAKGSLARLLWDLPLKMRRMGAKVALWQYISSPFSVGRNIVVIHDVLPFTHPHLFPVAFRLRCQLFFTISMLLAYKIIAVSDHARAEIAGRFPKLREKIVVVRNGPSFDEATYFGATAYETRERPYVLCVGRLEKRKNVEQAIQAFMRADIRDVDLVIVGKTDLGYQSKLQGLPANIIFLDEVGDQQLIDLYKGASLFVYPSLAEGFGLPLLDALLFGVPVISSNQTAMPEVGGNLAHYYDPTAPDAVDTLTGLVLGHFRSEPLYRPTVEERQERFSQFNWLNSGRLLCEQLLAARNTFRHKANTDEGSGR